MRLNTLVTFASCR